MTAVGAKAIAGPAWIADLLGPGAIAGASRLRWGFRNETWRVLLADGREVAITRLADAQAAARNESLARAIRPRLLEAGIPTPAAVDLGFSPEAGVLVAEFVDGTPGAELLESDGGPRLVGSILGDAWRRLAAIDTCGLPLETGWTRSADLAEASSARLDRTAPWLTRSERELVAADIATLPGLIADRHPGLVHGDLVPVNILVRDGALAALLDFESARIADRLFDAAWFDWILAFHHAAVEPGAWRAFRATAELVTDDPSSRALLRLLPLVRILEILDDDRLPAAGVDHWTRMLRAWIARRRRP